MALNIIILMTNLEIGILQMMALMNYVMTLVLLNHYKAQIGKDLHGTGVFYVHLFNLFFLQYVSNAIRKFSKSRFIW